MRIASRVLQKRFIRRLEGEAVRDLKRDMEETLEKCIPVTQEMLKTSLLQRFICAVVRIFAPML